MGRESSVLITGGAKGIGAACARLFIEESYKVSILDIDESNGRKIENELGNDCLFTKCDVSDYNQVRGAIQRIMERFGAIDILVNNVGIQTYGSVTDTTEDMWNKTLNVNLKSHFLCARAVIPQMQKQGKGTIISIASTQAFTSQTNVAAYTTSKSAILGLIRSIAVDYGPMIRAVAICPGSIDTPMLQEAIATAKNPQVVLEACEKSALENRLGSPEEVAQLILFVASDKAPFINGHPIRIDGGQGVLASGSGR